MNRVIFFIIAAMSFFSCGSNGHSATSKAVENVQSLDSVLVSLKQIDSSAREQNKADESVDVFPGSEESWNTFYNLCMSKKFSDALDYFFSLYEDEGRWNQCLYYLLPYPDMRYLFLVSVIRPMMNALRSESFASEHYITLLRADKDIDDTLIKLDQKYNEGNRFRVTEVYPVVVMDLGYSLGKTGHLDDALALSGDLYTAFEYLFSGDAWKAAVQTAKYRSRLFVMEGDNDGAMKEWTVLESMIDANKEYLTADQISDMRKEVDMARRLIQ